MAKKKVSKRSRRGSGGSGSRPAATQTQSVEQPPSGPPLSIAGMRYRSIHVRSDIPTFGDVPEEVYFSVGILPPQVEVRDPRVAFLATVVFRIFPKGSKKPFMTLAADTEIVYGKEHPAVGDDAASKWALENGLYHLWPYWREFVQAALARLDLPPVRLPLMYSDRLPDLIVQRPSGEQAGAASAAAPIENPR